MLPKKGAVPGTSDAYRLAVDFRALNDKIFDDSYPAVHMDVCMRFLEDKLFKSTLDIRWGYHNLSCSENPVGDLPYSTKDVITFSSELDSYSYKRLPLGVKPAGALFCKRLNEDLKQWLYQDLVAYIDDVMIGHNDKTKHLQTVGDVLVRLCSCGYSVRRKNSNSWSMKWSSSVT